MFTDAPLMSKTGVFTLVFYEGAPKSAFTAIFDLPHLLSSCHSRALAPSLAGSEGYGRGSGVSANYTSLPAPPGAFGLPAPAPPVAPAIAPPSREVAVASLPQLLAAAADRTVTSIVVRARIALGGATVRVAGAGRALAISGDAAACGALSLPGAPGPVPPTCALDAGWRSRHFEARLPTTRPA